MGMKAIWMILPLALLPGLSFAQANSWTNSAGGNWDQTNSWSLGILPDNAESIYLTNSGNATVEINSGTIQDDASSLSIYSLVVSGSNTLLLNNIGTNISLAAIGADPTYERALNLINGGTLVSSNSAMTNSGLFIDTGTLSVTGGYFACPGADLLVATVNLINTEAELGGLSLITAATVNQSGGTTSMGALQITGGGYNLNGGYLTTTSIHIQEADSAAFMQQGGTNQTGSLNIYSILGDLPPSYTLVNGTLCAGGELLDPGDFFQTGGSHIVTNVLEVEGTGYEFAITPADFELTDGSLLVGTMVFATNGGPVDFTANNATVGIAGTFQVGDGGLSQLILSGGILSCQNLNTAGGALDIVQNSGSLVVTDLFQFAGYYSGGYNGIGNRFPIYSFTGGTLTASNIELDAQWMIGSGLNGSVTNSGCFQMAGALTISNSVEHFGHFILSSAMAVYLGFYPPSGLDETNALINFAGTSGQLRFADSSGEIWTNGSLLIITNWSGLPSGGGNDQLYFGADSTGLTASQLSQIQFINPSGLPLGTYPAIILDTGEVVPDAPQWLVLSQQGNNLVLSWSPGETLQDATNVAGPYTDIAGAVSPYTNVVTNLPQLFFRLKQ
jgi:hypothetical protein